MKVHFHHKPQMEPIGAVIIHFGKEPSPDSDFWKHHKQINRKSDLLKLRYTCDPGIIAIHDVGYAPMCYPQLTTYII